MQTNSCFLRTANKTVCEHQCLSQDIKTLVLPAATHMHTQHASAPQDLLNYIFQERFTASQTCTYKIAQMSRTR